MHRESPRTSGLSASLCEISPTEGNMWQIYGQDHIIRQLDAGLKAGRTAHAYLLVGPPHVGKMALAVNMAQAVNCLAGNGGKAKEPGIGQPAPLLAEPEETGQTAGLMDGFAGFDNLDSAAAGNLFGDLSDSPSDSMPVSVPPPDAVSDPAPGIAVGDAPGSVPCGDCVQCRRIAQGIHADVKIVGVGTGEEDGPARRDIRIEQVREIESFLNLTPYEGSRKVIIMDGAELLNAAAANALLKTLEEPPADALLLLLTANEDALLSTIRSRCSALYLKPAAKTELENRLVSEYAAAPELAEQLARLSRGCLGQAVNALRDAQILEQRDADLERLLEVCDGGLDARFDYAAELATRFNRDREATRELLFLWLRWWRDLLLIKEGAEEYIHNADRIMPLRLQATRLTTAQVVAFIKRLNRTLEALDANANARLALETLMLGLPTVSTRA